MQRNCSLWAKKSFWSFYTRTWIRAFIAQRKLHSAASNPFICTEVSFGSDSPGPLCLWTLLITVKSRPFVCDRVVIGPRPGLLQRRRGLKKKTANKNKAVFLSVVERGRCHVFSLWGWRGVLRARRGVARWCVNTPSLSSPVKIRWYSSSEERRRETPS